MKRFGAACALALAVIGWTAGCNDYGNTFQAPTGASLTSIAPSNASVGNGTFTLNLFGAGFVPKTVVQWNGKTIPTTVTTDVNNNVLTITATVDTSLISKPGLATVNTLNPHSGTTDNGLSNTINFVINPTPNPLPELDSITPSSTAPGSGALTLNLTGKQFLPTSDPSGGSQVRWNANGTQNTLAVSSVSATQIAATVPADLLASQTCAVVSVYNPPAVATTPPSGVGNPYNGGGGTSSNGAGFFPGFAVSSDSTFITNCATGLATSAQKASAALAVAEETPALGSDGRFVAYTATQNGYSQVFLRDTCAGVTTDCQPHTALLSAASDGTAGNADSNTPSMSADGRFVAFSSAATNLVSTRPTGRQIFVRDTCFGATTSCTPQTTLVSIDEAGALAGNDNLLPSLSSSGRFVAFLSVTPSKYPSQSGAPNSGIRQIFVRDTCFGAASSCTPKTTRLSVMPGDTTSLQSKPAGPAISSSAQAVGVSSATTPTVLTRSVPVDDRVFLALTNSAQK
jgi:hypothetical protein